MCDGFRSFISSLAVIAAATSVVAAESGKADPKEVTITEFGLTLIPPPGFVRSEAREAELRKTLPAFMLAKATTVIFELDPAILKRDKSRLSANFIIAGSKVDTTAMTPDRQLRIGNLGAGDSHYNTQTSDLKIAGFPAKRYQYRQKPLIGEPVKGLFDGNIKYYFCRPGLMLSVTTQGVSTSEKTAEHLLKDSDAAVGTFKFSDK